MYIYIFGIYVNTGPPKKKKKRFAQKPADKRAAQKGPDIYCAKKIPALIARRRTTTRKGQDRLYRRAAKEMNNKKWKKKWKKIACEKMGSPGKPGTDVIFRV